MGLRGPSAGGGRAGAIANWGGESALAIRWLPILGSAILAWVVAGLARRLGGGGFAQVFSAAVVVTAPYFLFAFHVLSMNFAEVLLWSLGAWLLLAALDGERVWPWLALGLVVGVGLLTKHSLAAFLLPTAVGIVLAGRRDVLATWRPWLAAALAAALALPHVWWQAQHGWPVVEFASNAVRWKIAPTGSVAFLGALFGMMNVVAAPLLVGLGWWWLLGRRAGRSAAVLAWICLVAVAVFLTQHGKPYYATPAFPPLMAAGAVALERLTATRAVWRLAATGLSTVVAALALPFTLPLLPVDRFVAYSRALGVTVPSGERHEVAELPQHFADMHGWEELAWTVSGVYLALPEAERPTARVFGRNYGQAAALEFYASRYPMPPVISGHNSYWLWGPGDAPDGTVIVIGGRASDLADVFEHVEEAARTRCRLCMPYQRDQPIFVGRGARVTLRELWPRLKNFN